MHRLKSIRRSCSGVTPISLASIFHLSICPFFLFFVNSHCLSWELFSMRHMCARYFRCCTLQNVLMGWVPQICSTSSLLCCRLQFCMGVGVVWSCTLGWSVRFRLNPSRSICRHIRAQIESSLLLCLAVSLVAWSAYVSRDLTTVSAILTRTFNLISLSVNTSFISFHARYAEAI